MTEYETLRAALETTDIPFAEYGWETRPESDYGVITPDMEAGSLNGGDGKQDRAFDVSVDFFFRKLSSRAAGVAAIETAISGVCGSSWELNSTQYEQETGIFHIEWVCQCMGPLLTEETDGVHGQD